MLFRFSSLSGRRGRRDLHSFPTRRSSDLRSEERMQFKFMVMFQGFLATLGFATLLLLLFAIWQVVQGKGGEALLGGGGAVDRKSTRLNSSHRTSSYAVFCLKKKRT